MKRTVVLGVAFLAVASALAALVVSRRGSREDVVPSNPPPPYADAAPAFSGDRPNVVLVIGCTVRRDQVSPYGGHPATTPFLSEMAAHGVLFEDAVSAAPWTRAAATAIVTGRPFREVGMFEPAERASTRVLAPQVVTLAEVFRDAGYVTIGATANPNLNRVFGFEQGFDHYHQSSDLWRFGMEKVSSQVIVDRILPVIDERTARDAPVYLQVLLIDAHQPGEVDADTMAQLGDDVPEQVVRYRGLLQRFDTGVRRLWNGLSDRGFDDSNTIFVVVSDHGEGLRFPESQGKAHGLYMVPSVLEMTWLMRGRGVPAERRIGGLASQVDIFPTLTRLAGIDAPAVPGQDWSEQIRRGGRTTRTWAFAETDFAYEDTSTIFSEERVCSMRYRIGMRSLACFDRIADRYQTNRLAQPDKELVHELDAWRNAQRAAAETWPWASNAFPTKEERGMLEQLGYLDDQ